MFPGVTVPQAEAGKAAIADKVAVAGDAAAAGGLFSAASGLLGPVGLGLGIASQSGMLNGGGGMDMSKAVSGGTFYTGEMSYGGKPVDTNIVAIVTAVVVIVGLVLIFKGKRK